MSIPVYRLTCRNDARAALLAALLRNRGFVSATAEGSVMLFPWGGGFTGLSEVYDFGGDLNVASDLAWSDFLMQGADLPVPLGYAK